VTVTQAPTITTPAMMTGVGMILGTAAYMSPEQAKGRPADKRSDVWAFGCVLFEMLAGKRAFEGEDVSDTLANVLRGEPDWAALPSAMPRSVVSLLRRCVERDRLRRISDLSTVLFVLSEFATGAHAAPQGTSWPWPMSMTLAVLMAVAILGGVVGWNLRRPPQPSIIKFTLPLPDGQNWTPTASRTVAISPDGATLVYAANQQLYARTISELTPRVIPGTALGAEAPFFSPDGQWLGFFAASERKLRKILLAGGASIALCDVDAVNGASWASDDHIYFAGQLAGLRRVSASGGNPEVIVQRHAGEVFDTPQMLPDGHTLLFTVAESRSVASYDRARIVTQALGSNERHVVLEGGSDARYVPTKHLVYALGSTLLAVGFDPQTQHVLSGPVPVLEGVRRASAARSAAAQFSVSANGSIAYVPGTVVSASEMALALVDRSGKRTVLDVSATQNAHPRFSPDGKQLAFSTDDGREGAIWIYDLTRSAAPRRLTFEGRSSRPTWTPDGQRIVFRFTRGGEEGLSWQRADGNGVAEQLVRAGPDQSLQPEALSHDGKTLFLSVSQRAGGDRILATLHIGADKAVQPLVPLYSTNSSLSPDDRWLAYYSNDSGRNNIFVQPNPLTGAKYQLPVADARDPLWSHDGKHLFFAVDKGIDWELLSVPVQTQPTFAFGQPTPLGVEVPLAAGPRSYDVSPDGSQIAIVVPKHEKKPDASSSDSVNVVVNWFDELKARVPLK
jgi:serine/threonine-protein kinase